MNFCAIIALCALLTSSSLKMEFCVSPLGSDQNPGTHEKPFLSLERARDAVRNVPDEQQDFHPMA